jgi:hypothetical protein
MRSGDRPGLQNRRVAGFLSPMGSTPIRFRHFIFNRLVRFLSSIDPISLDRYPPYLRNANKTMKLQHQHQTQNQDEFGD